MCFVWGVLTGVAIGVVMIAIGFFLAVGILNTRLHR
jgi:hypothetical protein